MVRKSLMTQKEDDSFNSLIFDEYSDDECDPTHMHKGLKDHEDALTLDLVNILDGLQCILRQ